MVISTGSLAVRPATALDVPAVTETMTVAFSNDPLWGPAFPDPEHRREQAAAFWGLLVGSALRYPWTFVAHDGAAAAVWIPPGGEELDDPEHAGLDAFLTGLVGATTAAGLAALFTAFEQARPAEPHFYLSLLATHDRHRGHGLGMALLAENLTRIDALGLPAYLESCNPANDARYHRAGFVDRDKIVTASGAVVTTMYRPAHAT